MGGKWVETAKERRKASSLVRVTAPRGAPSPKAVEAARLHFVDGLSRAEVAARLGVVVPTVERRILSVVEERRGAVMGPNDFALVILVLIAIFAFALGRRG